MEFPNEPLSLYPDGSGDPQTLLTLARASFLETQESDGGVPDEFFDTLERVNIKHYKKDVCPICLVGYADSQEDENKIVVKLKSCTHVFDLECLQSWLKNHTSCPACRSDVLVRRKIQVDAEDDDEEPYDDTYM